MSEKQFAQRHSLSEEQFALAKMLGMGQLELERSALEFQKEMGYQGVEESVKGDRKRNLDRRHREGRFELPSVALLRAQHEDRYQAAWRNWHRDSTGTQYRYKGDKQGAARIHGGRSRAGGTGGDHLPQHRLSNGELREGVQPVIPLEEMDKFRVMRHTEIVVDARGHGLGVGPAVNVLTTQLVPLVALRFLHPLPDLYQQVVLNAAR